MAWFPVFRGIVLNSFPTQGLRFLHPCDPEARELPHGTLLVDLRERAIAVARECGTDGEQLKRPK
jgi:hypothetical protein